MVKCGLLASAILLGGCSFPYVATGPMEHESKVIETGNFEMARIELEMGAGELHMQGGSPKLVEAKFDYNAPAWKPAVESNTSSFRAEIRIRQPPNTGNLGNTKYKWDIRLNDAVPMNIVTHFGAGEAEMNLGSLDLQNLEIHMGVGELRLDLRGTPKRDETVEIHGGIGQATIRLPKEVGITATAKGGIGDISVTGLERRDGRWVNQAYDRSPARIHLDVKGGIGNIQVIAE